MISCGGGLKGQDQSFLGFLLSHANSILEEFQPFPLSLSPPPHQSVSHMKLFSCLDSQIAEDQSVIGFAYFIIYLFLNTYVYRDFTHFTKQLHILTTNTML